MVSSPSAYLLLYTIGIYADNPPLESLTAAKNMSSILIKQGTIVTMDERDSIVRGDLLIEGDRIASIGSNGQTGDTVIDASGCVVIPGFVQTHIHLCQTLFRGSADDLA